MKKNRFAIVAILLALSFLLCVPPVAVSSDKETTAIASEQRVYRDFCYSELNSIAAKDISTQSVDCKSESSAVASLDKNTLADLVGLVFSSDSGEIPASASVHIFNDRYEFYGQSDPNGYFVFCNIPVGTYNISVISNYGVAFISRIPVLAGVGKNYINIGLQSALNDDEINKAVTVSYRQCRDSGNRRLINPSYICPAVNVLVYDDVRPEFNGMYSVDMKTYIYHVVANELNNGDPLFNSLSYDDKISVLCAQSIAVRTFTFYQLGGFSSGMPHNGEYMCNQHNCCQEFKPYYTNELTVTAVDSCNALIMVDSTSYQPFWAKYCSSCDGHTRTSSDCPNNLISVTCNLHSPLIDPDPDHTMEGMCQNGACKLADLGYSYSDILNYYYSNIALTTYLGSTEKSIAPGETKFTYDSSQFYFYAETSANYTFILTDNSNWGVYLEVYDDANFYQEYSHTTTSSATMYLPAGLYHLYVEADLIGVGYNINNAPVAIHGRDTGYRSYMYSSYSKVYKFTAPESGYYTIDTEQWIDEDADTMLALLSSAGILIAYNDDRDNSTVYSHLYVYLSANTTYYIKIWTLDDDNISCKLFVYKGVYVE